MSTGAAPPNSPSMPPGCNKAAHSGNGPLVPACCCRFPDQGSFPCLHFCATPASNRGMRYLALATDYDGTLAHNGRVTESTLTALEALRASGRKLIMVTGRELPELKTVFPALELFDRVVVENGSLLYNPSTHHESLISEAP